MPVDPFARLCTRNQSATTGRREPTLTSDPAMRSRDGAGGGGKSADTYSAHVRVVNVCLGGRAELILLQPGANHEAAHGHCENAQRAPESCVATAPPSLEPKRWLM